MCSCSSNLLYLETEDPFKLQANLCTSLKWLSQSACFTKHFLHLGHATFLCLLCMCMLHSATLEKCLSQYLHFTWRSWRLVSRVTGSGVTCGSASTCVSGTVGCSSSLCSRRCSSSFRYNWHSSHFLCKLSRWLLKSQGNMNLLLHILHSFRSFL